MNDSPMRSVVAVHCNARGCDQVLWFRFPESMDAVRADQIAQGWTHTDAGDRCPAHSKAAK